MKTQEHQLLALTPSEVAAQTRIGVHEVRRAIRAGELKAAFVGRRMICPIEAVQAWLRWRAGLDS